MKKNSLIEKKQAALRQKTFYAKNKTAILQKNKEDRAFLKINQNPPPVAMEPEPEPVEIEPEPVIWNLEKLIENLKVREGVSDATRAGYVKNNSIIV
jgi:hypothetical protein